MFLTLGWAFSAPSGAAAPQDLPWFEATQWTTQEGLPQNSINSILQGQAGYLWLATNAGLVRFDGGAFKTFDLSEPNNPGSLRIQSVVETSDGTLWIGMYEGPGLAYFADGRFTHIQADAGIQKLIPRKAGGVWCASMHGIGIVTRDGLEWVSDHVLPHDSPSIRDIAEDRDGRLWITYHRGSDVLLLEDGKFRAIETSGHWRGVEQAPDGEVWFAGPGIAKVEGDQIVPQHEEFSCRNLFFDRQNGMWISRHEGLCRFTDGEATEINYRLAGLNELPRVDAFHADELGNVWLGTPAQGLVRLRPSRTTSLTIEDGLPDTTLFVVQELEDGRTLMGNSAGLFVNDEASVRRYPTTYPFTGAVTSLLWTRDERQLVAADDRIYELEPEGPRELLPTRSGPIRVIYEDRSGAIWVGTGEGLFEIGGEERVYRESDGLSHSVVVSLMEDDSGALWVGGRKGVSRIEDGKIHAYRAEPDGVAPGSVRCILKGPEGSVWFGTYGGGLCRFQDGKFSRITREQGLINESICGMVSDSEGHLYINSNLGVFRTHWEDLIAVADGRRPRIPCMTYGVPPGMTTNEGQGGFSPSGYLGSNGSVYFCAIEGLVEVLPIPDDRGRNKTRAEITQLRGAEGEVPAGTSIELPPHHRHLTIHYSALDLTFSESVQFRYRLLGHEDEWMLVGAERSAGFTELPPGDYTFEVSAMGEQGVWDPPSTLSVSVPPKFHETIWFVLLIVAGAVFGTALLLRLYLNQQARRAEWLEARIAQRTQELSEARDELEARVAERTEALAAANDSLQTDLAERQRLEQELVQAQKMESVGRLAGGVAHDFNNLLTVILGQTELASRRVFGPAKEKLADVMEAGERARQLTNQLLLFSKGQVGESVPLDTGATLTGIASIAQSLVGENHPLKWDLDPDLGWVILSPTQLEQLLINLCVNAAHAMPEGGTIHLRCRNLAVHEHAILEDGDYICLEVADTGHGIEDEVMPLIFEPFFSTKPSGRGTGLGLSVCYGIAQNAGGAIVAESQPGLGSVFRVWLPRVPSQGRPRDEIVPFRSNSNTQILVVEDSGPVRAVMTSMLRSLGCEVTTAAGGQEALDLLSAGGPAFHLILSDIVMPSMNGLELAERVRERWPTLPILFMSGYSDHVTTLGENSTFGARVLAKPISIETLSRELSDLLS